MQFLLYNKIFILKLFLLKYNIRKEAPLTIILFTLLHLGPEEEGNIIQSISLVYFLN